MNQHNVGTEDVIRELLRHSDRLRSTLTPRESSGVIADVVRALSFQNRLRNRFYVYNIFVRHFEDGNSYLLTLNR